MWRFTAHHQALDVEQFVAVVSTSQDVYAPAPVPVRPVWDWAAANQRKKDAVQQLAPLADALDDLEIRIAELMARTTHLELD